MQSCSHGSGRWTGKDFPTICSRRISLFSGRFPSVFSAHPCFAHQSVCLHHLRAQQRKSQWFLVRLRLFHGKCRESSFLSLICNAGQSHSRGEDLASGAKEGQQDAMLLSGSQEQFPAVPSLHFNKHHPSPPRAAAPSASWGC